MSNDAERVQRYRQHAAQLRELAKEVNQESTRAMLEAMAREWAQVADSTERVQVIPFPRRTLSDRAGGRKRPA